MLKLTRRIGEKILIGDDIEIIVLGICRNQARIGIEAPESVKILRKELKLADEQKQKEDVCQKQEQEVIK